MTQVQILNFSEMKAAVFERFSTMRQQRLFYVEVDRDEVFDVYLNAFPEEFRQEHNCNCCKSFLRQYSGIVTIEDNQMVTLWDCIGLDGIYRKVTDAVADYIRSRPITELFYVTDTKCGTDKNYDAKRAITWSHFAVIAPSQLLLQKNAIGPKLGQTRDDKQVLKRSLDELTLDATETVLELINQNSLYRGKEFEAILTKFVLLQRQYKRLPDHEKDCFCWANSPEVGAVARIRNTAIGTLLIDLSAGMDLDDAVSKFERVVAPTNYKRPTALVTPRMVEDAKEKIKELGLLESLERRFAVETDIRACDVLYKDKPDVMGDVFDQVAKDTIVNPKTLTKVEEIGIEDFLANVLPGAKSIAVLLENSHANNFTSLIAPQDANAPSMFKWDNGFSWSYTGAVTDSIKERVKAAGGNVVGELRASLSWFNYDDLDIYCKEPLGDQIYFRDKYNHLTSGKLDVDMNAGAGQSRSPVENIIWTDKSKMQEGVYTILVHNYNKRETTNSGFVVQIECNGETFDFEFKTNPANRAMQQIANFEYSKANGIKFQGENKSNVVSREKWGVKSNQFHKVTKILLSPNHWDKAVGNKHYLFMLEGCRSDESPRPFFNEFLKQELDQHRKVFEVVGGKLKIEDSPNQLSGLGFSETQRASAIVKVTGKFTRTLRVNF